MRIRSILADGRGTVFAALLACALLQTLVLVAAAWCVQQLFDRLTAAAAPAGTGTLAGLFVATAATAFLLELGQRRLGAELGLRYAASIRETLFAHLLNDRDRSAARQDKGSLLLPFVGDLTATRLWVSDGLARTAAAVVTITVLIAIIASQSLVLAAAVAAVLTAVLVALLALSRPLDRAVRDVRRRRGALAAFIAGRLGAVATIQASARAEREIGKAAARTERLNQAEVRRAWVTGTSRGLVQLSSAMLILATVLIGLGEIAGDALTAGAVVAALSLIGLIGTAIADLGRAFELWHPARVASERIERVLGGEARSRSTPASAPAAKGRRLVLREAAVRGRLEPVSGRAAPGEVVLVEGAPGSGKSTLLGMIAQIVPPTKGSVRFRGRDPAALGAGARRRMIGFATPALALLPGSLGMNLRYRASDAPEEEVRALASACGLDRLIERNGGLDGRIPDTATLSLGEFQGIALVRALVGEPPLLLLDSVDSHLEAATIDWLAGRLASYPGIVVMVTGRPALRATASQVWTLGGGGARLEIELAAPRSSGRELASST